MINGDDDGDDDDDDGDDGEENENRFPLKMFGGLVRCHMTSMSQIVF